MNHYLIKICDDFKRITNIKKNYIEYISALLYLKYFENEEYFKIIYETRNFKEVTRNIDDVMKYLRNDLNNQLLFSNISFENIMNAQEVGAENFLKDIIEKIFFLEQMTEKNKKESKKMVAKSYEYLLEELVKKGDIIKEKEIYTPFYITDLMAFIVDTGKENVFDPNCGTGNFLISACKKVQKVIGGTEDDISIYNICMTNLFLHDLNNVNIKCQTNIIEKEKYHTILMNPPFSQKNWMKKMNPDDLSYIFRNGLPENSVGDYAYVLSMLNHLEADGKMAVVLPHGVLFRQKETDVRKRLILNNYIDAIIGLPENLFYSNRISVIILILSKQKKEQNVLFIDASKDYINNRKNNVISEEVQKKIIKIYQERETVKNYSYLASKEEIVENNFDLSIKKYIKEEKEKSDVISKEEILKELTQLEAQKKNLENEMNEFLASINQ